MLNLKSNTFVYGALLCVFVLFVADFAEARGRGGGGRSFSRSGPASHGGFSSSARTQPSRQVNRPSQGQVARPNKARTWRVTDRAYQIKISSLAKETVRTQGMTARRQ